jgi:hypothetical protein
MVVWEPIAADEVRQQPRVGVRKVHVCASGCGSSKRKAGTPSQLGMAAADRSGPQGARLRWPPWQQQKKKGRSEISR